MHLSTPALLGLLALAAGACTPAENAAQGTKSLAQEAGQATTDASITFAVKAKMIKDEQVKAGQINVDTVDGVVTLNGTQPSEAAKARAEEIARSGAAGVKKVVNNLTVVPPAAP